MTLATAIIHDLVTEHVPIWLTVVYYTRRTATFRDTNHMAYGLRAKIAPGVEINDIHIHLAPDRPPEVRLEGATRHAKTSRIIAHTTIKTVVLGPAGVAFINEMKEAFGTHVSAQAKGTNEREFATAVGRREPNGNDE